MKVCDPLFNQVWPNAVLYSCGKRSDDFSVITLRIELMKYDSVNRRFLRTSYVIFIQILETFPSLHLADFLMQP